MADPEEEEENPEALAIISEAVTVLRAVCREAERQSTAEPPQAESSAQPAIAGGAASSSQQAPSPPAAEGEAWKAQLEDGLRIPRQNELVASVLRGIGGHQFHPQESDLKSLTLDQVRSCRDELIRLEKLETLRKALFVLRKVQKMLVAPKQSEASASSAEPVIGSTSSEGSWQRSLALGLRDLRRSEDIRAALEIAAPGIFETALEAASKDLPQEADEAAILAGQAGAAVLAGISPEHVQRLHDELQRFLEQAERGAMKPRALVRAMQMLYLAKSVEEAEVSLHSKSADEEALQQLTDRTEDFAPALASLRALAVDKEVFAHMEVEHEAEHEGGPDSESEASDIGKELVGRKETAPVVLPPGWRLVWVRRKKREAREFVDPEGKQYSSVKEVRAALAAWEAREAAVKEAEAATEAAASGTFEADPSQRRMFRVRGKRSPSWLYGSATMPPGTSSSSSQPCAESGPVPDSGGYKTGTKVVLVGLQAKPELNGQQGELGQFNVQTGRWECFMEDGETKVNVRPSNLELVPDSPPASAVKRRRTSVAEAPALADASPAAKSQPRGKAKAKAKLKIKGKGRGRPKKKAEAPQEEEEGSASD